jgi:hypothetical protein
MFLNENFYENDKLKFKNDLMYFWVKVTDDLSKLKIMIFSLGKLLAWEKNNNV